VAYKFKRSDKLFSALANPFRLNVLQLLYANGALGYSAIMKQLHLDVSQNSGKFAYHLQILKQAKLVNADKRSKKYQLTPVGKAVVIFLRSLGNSV